MNDGLTAVKVTEHVHWVGAVDWGMRDFHGYRTGRGTTYNAYLITADKVTLVDTVRAGFEREMLARIASALDPPRIDYLISNHAEVDHSGGLPLVVAQLQPQRVFASTRGVAALRDHFHLAQEITPVKDGESLSLGNMTLSFVETPMLHWPESMFTYLADERVLFSSDAFGMHLASSERFADQVEDPILLEEASRYYANILLPLSPVVTRTLERVGKLNLEIEVIATAHGPIWRRDLQRILALYRRWAAGGPFDKALVVYDTMWHSTDLMARAVADGLAVGGACPKLMPLKASHRSDVAAELLDAGALIVGSSCLNGGMLPAVADVLAYIKGLKPIPGSSASSEQAGTRRRLVGAAFGSYGWSGGAVEQVEAALREMGIEVIADAARVKYVPDDRALSRCFALGAAMAEKLKSAGMAPASGERES